MTGTLLQTTPTGPGSNVFGGAMQGIINLLLLPLRILVAVVLPLLALYVVGPWAGEKLSAVANRVDFGSALMETPLGAFFRDEREIEGAIETLVTYFFVLVALLFSFGILGFRRMIDYVRAGANYYPSLIGGVAVLFVGFVVAGYVSRNVKETEVVGETKFAPVLALVGRGVVYFVSVTLALDAFGYSTAILNTMAQAVAIGVGLGVALAVGIGLGMGSQDYVADHIDEWVGSE